MVHHAFSHKATSSDKIDKIQKVVLDKISDNRAVLVQTVKYDATNKIDKL